MTIKNISEKPKTFLGIDIPNWIAIIGILGTFIAVTIAASSKVSAIETKTENNYTQIQECKTNSRQLENKVNNIDNAVNRIDGKMDILLQRTK